MGSIVKVDLNKIREVITAIGVTESDPAGMLRYVAEAARAKWVSLAQSMLKTTSRDYIGGLQEVEIEQSNTKQVASIALVGQVPNMVENGWPGGDLRKTVIGGPGTKTAKDGSRYVTVPFRHGTPGTGGRNVGRPMPKPIHNAAKALAATLSAPGRGTSYGGRLDIGGPTVGKAADRILRSKEKPWHWGSIYRGMIREEKTYEGATQNQYITFRRISTNVKRGAAHWFHPGIRAVQLVLQVQAYVDKIVGGMHR